MGHSTRSLPELVALLRVHAVEVVVDVRSFPTSARVPHFNRDHLTAALAGSGIRYVWLGDRLGGYRKKTRSDFAHKALRSPGFRNYADHMEGPAFRRGIEELLSLARGQPTVYMCAERLWWRCHRSLISDYLSALCGLEITHILDEKRVEAHRLHRSARVAAGKLIYDVGATGSLLSEAEDGS